MGVDPVVGRYRSDRSILRELSVAAALPAALHYQRRTASLLADLRASLPTDAFAVEVGSGRIDGVDLLLSDILQSGGTTLGFADLLDTATRRGERGLVIEVPVRIPELDRAARVVRAHGGDIRVRVEADLASQARAQLYPAAKLARYVRAASTRLTGPGPAPEVLLVAQVPHHVGDLAAVAERLRSVEGRSVGFAVEDATTARTATEAGFDVVGAGRRSPRTIAAVMAGAASVLARFDRATRRATHSVERDAFAAAVRGVLRNHLARALLLAADADALVGDPAVRAVVTVNPYSRVGRGVARTAERMGTPVIAIEHGSVFADDPRWADCPITAMCAWGEPSRRALIANGIPAEKITVTGAPRFDEPDARTATPGDLRRVVDQVLVATSGAGDHVSLDVHLRFLDLLARAVRGTPELSWVIKLHPKDRIEHYDELAASPNVTIVEGDRSNRSSIFDHLERSCCLVTVSSMTAMDALRTRTPVVAVWLTGDEPPEFIARTAARVVGDADDLALAARAAAAGELQPPDPQYLAEHYAFPGRATANVCAVIDRCISAGT